MSLIDEARAVARKTEEVASYHVGTDLMERLRYAEEGMAAQRTQMMAAVQMIHRLVEEISGRPA